MKNLYSLLFLLGSVLQSWTLPAASSSSSVGEKERMLNPTRIPVSFANKIEDVPRTVTSTFEEEVLYFNNVWDPYDRDLPPEGGNLCDGNWGTIAVDESVKEQYPYSCCERNDEATDNNMTKRCPIPPPEDPDVLRALLFERPVEVWAWRSNNGSSSDGGPPSWRKLPVTFTYYDPVTPVGYAKRILAIFVITTFVMGVLSIVASILHQGTNRLPGLCFLFHVLTLACIWIVASEAMAEVRQDPSYRGQIIRAGLVHTYIILLMSMVVIYIPAASEEEDQRIRSACGERLSKCAHTKVARRTASIICALHAIVGDVLGSYALIDSCWSILDSEFETLIGIALCYSIASTIHVVSFFTAIYQLEVPLRLGEPQTLRRTGTGSRVKLRRHLVGVHRRGDGALMPVPGWRGTPFHVYASKERCDGGITLSIWDVGILRQGVVDFYHDDASHDSQSRKSSYCGIRGRGKKRRNVHLPGLLGRAHSSTAEEPLHAVTVSVCNGQGDFEKIGSIVITNNPNNNSTEKAHNEKDTIIDAMETGIFHYDLSIEATIIQTVLHVSPKPSEDGYSLNVVHNMRQWAYDRQRQLCHRITCCGQPVYGILWWVALVAASISSITIISAHVEASFLLPFYLLEMLSVIALCLFAAVVGLFEAPEEGDLFHRRVGGNSSKRSRVLPMPHHSGPGKMRDGTFTCFNGHSCILTTAGIGWQDDMTMEEIEPGASSYYCYRCDFCVRKND